MNGALLSSKNMGWCTPADFFSELDQEFHFNLDPAATLSDRGQQVSRSDVGPILTKAQAAGLIRNAGKRECSVTGRSAIAWKAEKEVFHGNKPNHKGNPEGEL